MEMNCAIVHALNKRDLRMLRLLYCRNLGRTVEVFLNFIQCSPHHGQPSFGWQTMYICQDIPGALIGSGVESSRK